MDFSLKSALTFKSVLSKCLTLCFLYRTCTTHIYIYIYTHVIKMCQLLTIVSLWQWQKWWSRILSGRNKCNTINFKWMNKLTEVFHGIFLIYVSWGCFPASFSRNTELAQLYRLGRSFFLSPVWKQHLCELVVPRGEPWVLWQLVGQLTTATVSFCSIC